MALCTQNFKKILNLNATKKLFGDVISEEFFASDINLDEEDNIWYKKIKEISNSIVLKSAENEAINAYEFSQFITSVDEVLNSLIQSKNIIPDTNTINKLELFKNSLFEEVKAVFIKSTKLATNPVINGNPLYDFSSLSKLLFEVSSYENYYKSLINTGLFKTIFVNNLTSSNNEYPYENFVVTDAQLNKNLSIYKNELWDYVYKYYKLNHPNPKSLSSNKLYDISETQVDGQFKITLNEDLFTAGDNDLSIYAEVMQFLAEQMELSKATTGSNLKIIHGNSYTVAQAYIKSLALINFDSAILSHHSDKVSINLDNAGSFSLPSNGLPKYQLLFRWSKNAKIDNSGITDINESSTSLVKLLAYVIPYYEKTIRGKKEVWTPNEFGLTIGKSNLDSIGAVINDLNPSMKYNVVIGYEPITVSLTELFNLYSLNYIDSEEMSELVAKDITTYSLNGRQLDLFEILQAFNSKTLSTSDILKIKGTYKFNVNKRIFKSLNLGELFLLYDEGKFSFKQILETLINDVSTSDNTVLGRVNILNSVYQFLYGTKGLHGSILNWRNQHMEVASAIINPEIALINHIRTTVKNTYTQFYTKNKSKFIDVIDLDASTIYDYEKLMLNLSHSWKYNKVSLSTKINSFEDFINLLTNKDKGSLELSEKTKTAFLEKHPEFNSPEFYNSIGFKDSIGYLLSISKYPKNQTINENSEQETFDYTLDQIIDKISTDQGIESNLHLKDLFKISKRNSRFGIVRQIKKSTGSSMPTMGISNLGSLFAIAVNKTNNFYRSNPGFYKRTTNLMEVVGNKGSKDFFKLNAVESFKAGFVKGFLESAISNNEFVVQPFNFSDKSSIMGIVLSTLADVSVNSDLKASLSNMTSDQLKEAMYNAQNKYYSDLSTALFNDFQILDNESFKSSISKTDKKLEAIANYLETINEEAAKTNIHPKVLLSQKINEKFNKGKYLEITEDLHYSVYFVTEVINGKSIKVPKLKINQLLKAYVAISSDKELFNKWATNRESAFIRESTVTEIPLSEISFSTTSLSPGIKKKEIEKKFGNIVTTVKTDKAESYKIELVKNNALTEIAKKYLWSKNLVVSQFMNTTVKDTFLHPYKGEFREINFVKDPNAFNILEEEDSLRSTTFTKRMNVIGASISIYGKGREGILTNAKMAVMTDPTAPVYNQEGDSKNQEVYDGGAIVSGIYNELLKWAMPGYNLQSSQKPLAESITSKTSTTLKFATFALSNEEIRISIAADKPVYTIMKKMHDFNLWEDNEFSNIFAVPDLQTRELRQLDITEMSPNHYVFHNGEYKKIISLEYAGTNNYIMHFEKGESKPFVVNTLFDLWEAFGGAYSAHLNEKGEIEEDEASMRLVAELIKTHKIFESDLNLMDKLISMLLPQSAVKKGATNINNYNDIYNTNNKLSYFNFDTSFFGVQLDPFHSTEDGSTNEITQVMSAIAEMASSPELYNLVYDTISFVVEQGLKKFNTKVASSESFKKIISLFVERMNNSSQINNARAIINGLSDDLENLIPLDNKTIYKQFVSFLIAETNAEFVRRKFAGTSSTLRPSYGFMQIFESKEGKKYLAPDLIKKFDSLMKYDPNFKELGLTLNLQNNVQTTMLNKLKLVLNYLPEFKADNIIPMSIRPLDILSFDKDITFNNKVIKAGEVFALKAYNEYFELKELLNANPDIQVFRQYSKSRDLKPVDITFKSEVIVNNTLKLVERSVWDTEAFHFKWWLQKNQKQILEGKDKKYNHFIEYIKSVDNLAAKETDPNTLLKIATAYASRWMSRTFNLLSANKLFKTYNELLLEDPKSNPFLKMFEYTSSFEGKKVVDSFKFRFENTYSNTIDIQDYVHRNPENIHTNVNRNNFGISGDMPIAGLSKNYFRLKNSDLDYKSNIPFDVVLHNTLDKTKKYIVVEGLNYTEINGNLYKNIDIKKAKDAGLSEEEIIKTVRKQGEEITILTDPEGEYRIGNFGNKLYRLPKKYKVFKDVKGNEILLIKPDTKTAIDELGDLLSDYSDFDYIQTKDKGFYTVGKLLSENDDYLKLLNVIKANVQNKELRSFYNRKVASYKKFKESVIPKDPQIGVDRKVVMDQYNTFIETEYKKHLDGFIEKIAKIRYTSFEKSLESIAARIPAQAMQSFMGMDTVAFIKGDANDVYVSHWQLFLQGSDYDIDKIYMMMYAMKNGLFVGWSPSFDLTQFNKSEKIPLPTGKKYKILSPEKMTITSSSTQDDGTKVEFEETLTLDNPKVLNIDALLAQNNLSNAMFLDKFIKVLDVLKESDYTYIYATDVEFSKAITRHESYFSEDGFKNFIVNKLMAITRHPNNQVSAATPISFGVYDDIKKSITKGSYKLSPYDGVTMGKQQEQNAVGKEVIGVAATGLKDYFALVKYYNDRMPLYTSDNNYFLKNYTINGKQYFLNKISGLNSSEKIAKIQQETLFNSIVERLRSTSITLNVDYINQQTALGKSLEQIKEDFIINSAQELSKIKHDEDAALVISSILSLATDNAKELMLAKINAGIDFAGMHIYMIILGVDPVDVTKFMTSNEAWTIKESLTSDIFSDEGKSVSIIKKLNKLASDRITILKKENNLAAIASDPIINFYKIYSDAQELVSLGSYLKVNQGSKATEEELYKLLNSLRYSIINQTKSFTSKIKTITPVISKDGMDLVEMIQIDKPYLKNSDINDIMTKANSLGISTLPLDIYRFFNDDNYRQDAINYYNLIKSTFNNLDILAKVPHFKSMYKSFVTVDKVLGEKTNKHYFNSKLNKVIDLIFAERGSLEMDFNVIKMLKINSDINNPSSPNSEILDKINDYLDNRIIFNFFKSANLKFDIIELMNHLGINEISLLENDLSEVKVKNYTKEDIARLDKRVLSLDNQYGLALFRYLMEEYIIPNEKKIHSGNGFLKHYVKTNHLTYNLANKISYYLDESNFGELEELELGLNEMEGRGYSKTYNKNLLSAKPVSYNLKIQLSDLDEKTSAVTNIGLLDLLTIYNLLTNEGRFGGNRASNLFYKNLENKNAISRRFLNYEKSINHTQIDNIIQNLESENNINSRVNFLLKLFGEVNIKDKDKPVILKIQKNGNPHVVNRYFNFADSGLETAIVVKNEEFLTDDIIDISKLKNVLLDKECN